MPFFGDRCGELWPPPSCRYISMPTAIARVYTSEGFVIAADGLKTRSDTGMVASNSERKIFEIEQPGRCLAYAFAGAVQLTSQDSDEILFDFIARTKEAADRLAKERPRSLWHYTERLAEEIEASLDLVKEASGTFDPALESQQTYILMDGYYGKHPKRLSVTFKHHAHEPAEVNIAPDNFFPGQPIGYGSEALLRLLNSQDPAFAAYYVSPQDPNNVTLAEAVQIAANRIRAHRDPEAIKIDEKACSAVGGILHIATITYTGGFQWAPGFGWPGTLEQILP
jgi:hypothetical protein